MPDTTVIVLDPGHGGENEGLNYHGLLEKDMNLVVAESMRDALMQFDDVEVYITNPEKTDMSLKQRAEYAQSVGADCLISLHFNMSEEHIMYGSEAWIPGKGLGYSKMHALGDIFMDQFEELGLTIRGVKTRLNDEGKDYYGIIRESAELSIPCVLVEHGYADHDRDFPFLDTPEDWKALGNLDAQAVAKFYGLKSTSLGTDYSGYVKNGYFAPEEAVGSDVTEPVDAVLIWQEGDLFLIGATEEESELVYYDYSCDGGKTWSQLLPFARSRTRMEIQIPEVMPGSQVTVRIYNGHFLYAQTNVISFLPMETREESSDVGEDAAGALRVAEEGQEYAGGDIDLTGETGEAGTGGGFHRTGLLFSGFGIFLSLMLFLAAYATYRLGNRVRTGKRERFLFIGGLCALLLSVTAMGLSLLLGRQNVETATQQSAAAQAATETGTEDRQIQENAQQEAQPNILIMEGENGQEEKLPIREGTTLAEEETAVIYDIAEGFLRVPLLETVSKNPYQLSAFSGADLQMQYSGGGYQILRGIDVSKFQGSIDWSTVAQSGVDFAILRLGLRGYGSGELVMDARFYENLEGAQAQGLRTGVYFFSAAINEEEAVEEAQYVLKALQGYDITMPVVFDTEPIYYDKARTDDLTPARLTAITRAFCEEIKNAGYTPMIYANAKRFTTVLHLEQLKDYALWLADYRQAPDFPYAFSMWQFTEKGSVPGIEGAVDIDLYFEPTS